MTNKFIYVLILVLISSYGLAQESGKLSFQLYGSPQMTYRSTIKFNDPASFKEHIDSTEQFAPAWSAGIGISYRITPRLSIRSGLQYATKNLKTIVFDLAPQDPNDPLLLGDKIQFHYRYSYLEIPLHVNYTLSKGKFSTYLSAGLELSKHLDAKQLMKWVGTEHKSKTDITNENFNCLMLSASLGAGVEYKLSDHISLYAEPRFSHALTPQFETSSDKNLARYPYAIAATIGVQYRM